MNNEVLQNIKTRRSIRKYKAEQIKEDELQAVLEAGTYAPSGRGMQSPLLVAVQDKAAMKQIVKMNAAVMGTDSNPYYDAPTVVLVFAPEDRTTWLEDGSCVLDTMMLAAHSIGLGSCWIHREREMFDTEEGKALMKQWGVPENYKGIGALALGYGNCPLPEAPERKDGRIVMV
ncbi:MAG: nitroreductase family protein [Firmicutes bacterium]|nr:nitroreductase family protein [Bacillota bacterium]